VSADVRRAAEGIRQEAAQRVHAVHEGVPPEGHRRVHSEGVGCHQPDPRSKGMYNHPIIKINKGPRSYSTVIVSPSLRVPARVSDRSCE